MVIIQAAKKASERKSFRGKGGKNGHVKATLFLCKHKHLIAASKETKLLLRMSIIKFPPKQLNLHNLLSELHTDVCNRA